MLDKQNSEWKVLYRDYVTIRNTIDMKDMFKIYRLVYKATPTLLGNNIIDHP